MITGFEKITQPLSDNEIEAAKYVFEVLQENKDVYIKNKEIAEFIVIHGRFYESRIRIIVHYIRVNLCKNGYIIATSNGYCYTENKDKIKEYLRSLEERINSQQEVYERCVGVLGGLSW